VVIRHAEKNAGGSLVVTGGQPEPAVVRLQPCGEAIGRLVDGAGRPVCRGGQSADVDVAFLKEFDQGWTPLSQGSSPEPIAADGRFRFRGLVPGVKYLVDFQTDQSLRDAARTTLPLVVKPGEVKDLGDVRLVPSRRPDGGP
jgi:hypothetical protein